MKPFNAIARPGPVILKSLAVNGAHCASLAASQPAPGDIVMNTPFLVKLAAVIVALTVNGLILRGVEYLFNA